jgi:hypothetical protein
MAVLALATLALLLLYPVPAFIAFMRGHPNRFAILALDLLVGWTFLGWVAALVWALTEVQPGEVHIHHHRGARRRGG